MGSIEQIVDMTIDFRQVIISLSYTLDLVGVNEVQHGKRVAFMAVQCSKALGYDEQLCQQIFDAALLHDIGVSSSEVHHQLISDFNWSQTDVHCQIGYQLVQSVPSLRWMANIIRYHHTRWSELQQIDDIDSHDAELANLVCLVTMVDTLAAPLLEQGTLLDHYEEIRNQIREQGEDMFALYLIDAFLRASSNFAFWIALESRYIQNFVHEMTFRKRPKVIHIDEVRAIAELFARIVDAKSRFTVEHSQNVANLTEYLAEKMGFSPLETRKIGIAGLLHDIGKLRIPDEILDKPGTLSHKERTEIAMHSFETYEILRRIDGMEDIALWAAYHHEKLNGDGYPFNPHVDALPLQARILSVADVFQALSQNRPYRGRMPQQEVLQHLHSLVDAGEIDAQVVAVMENNLDECYAIATHETVAN